MTPLATYAIPLMLAGTGIAAYGQYQQGQAAEQEAKNAAAISEYNARVAEQEGKAQELKSVSEAQKFARQGEALLAEQQVRYSKGGVLTGVGTPVTVGVGTAKQLEIDRQMILREGTEAVKFAESRAAGMRLQAKSYRQQGKYAGRGAILSATGTVLSGLGAAGYARYQLKK